MDSKAINDYYPFGMLIAADGNNRTWQVGNYRYGYNGQERSLEIDPNGNHNTAEFWEYDARLGRRWNLDPKPVTGISDYATFLNNPILFSDFAGDSVNITMGEIVDPTVHRRNLQAFEAFALTKEGRKWILDRAQKGYEYHGTIYKDLHLKADDEGKLSKQGVDYSIRFGGKEDITHAFCL